MLKIIQIGSLAIPSYLLCAAAGAVICALLAYPALRRIKLTKVQIPTLLLIMCAAFLAGARLWNVAVYPINYCKELHWYSLRMSGLSLYGGLTGSLAALITLCALWKRSVWPLLDAMTVPGGAAFCIARVGCFLNGCCTGRATNSVFGVVFPANIAVQEAAATMFPFVSSGYAVWPTQLLELLGTAIGLPLVILATNKLNLKEGGRFLLFGAWFSLARLLVLPLRVLPYPDYIKNICYPLLYIGIAAACAAVLVFRQKSYRDNPIRHLTLPPLSGHCAFVRRKPEELSIQKSKRPI